MKILYGELIQSSKLFGFLEIWISFCSLLIEILLFVIGPAQTLLLLEGLPDFCPEIPLLITVLQDPWLPLWNLTSLYMTLLGPYHICVALYLWQLHNVLSAYLYSKKLLGGGTLSFTINPLPFFSCILSSPAVFDSLVCFQQLFNRCLLNGTKTVEGREQHNKL